MASSSNPVTRKKPNDSVLFADHINAGNGSPQQKTYFNELAPQINRTRDSRVLNRSRVEQHQSRRKRKNNEYDFDDEGDELHHMFDEEEYHQQLQEQEPVEDHEEEDILESANDEEQERRCDERPQNRRASGKRSSKRQHNQNFQCRHCGKQMKFDHNLQTHVAKCMTTVLQPEQDERAKVVYADLFEYIANAKSDPTIPLPHLPTDSNGIVVLSDARLNDLHFSKYRFQLP